MKYQCGFCKSEDVETLFVDEKVIVMCHVCNVESVVEYPESLNYFISDVIEDFTSGIGNESR